MNTETPFNKELIRVVIGLGNPGQKYYKTRHSIGFRVVDELADAGGSTWQNVNNMSYAVIEREGLPTLYLIKPQTFMNSSGAVLPWVMKKGIKGDQIVVVHDELEKGFGCLQMRLGGSARGHNGLRSIIESIGQDFWRLRFGIGRPSDATPVGDFVLQPFNVQEEEKLKSHIVTACRYLV